MILLESHHSVFALEKTLLKQRILLSEPFLSMAGLLLTVNATMKDIKLQECIDFQDCFLFEGKFSPFEEVEDFRTYYPRVLMGEIGGLMNLSCKQVRSSTLYGEDIEDECVDIFIYLLLFGRMLEIHDHKKVLNLIRADWNNPVTPLSTEDEFYCCCIEMMEKVLCLVKPGKEQHYDENYFYRLYLSIVQSATYVSSQSWQQLINNFHQQVIRKHTDPSHFTPDGLYRGSFHINIDRLLAFVQNVDIKLPEKRVSFLKRMRFVQSELHDEKQEARDRMNPIYASTSAAFNG